LNFDQIFSELSNEIIAKKYDFLEFNNIKLSEITSLASELIPKYNNICVIGFGASSLNTRALISSIARPTKKIVYLDSLDQLEMEGTLHQIDLSNSIFFSLSKSGNTHETYFLTKYILQVKNVNPRSVYVISPYGDNLLFNLAKDYGLNHLEHDVKGSGRFGIISAASLLPSILVGVDASKVISSAAKTLSDILFEGKNIKQTAKWYLDNYYAGKRSIVMLNYCYQLDGLCRWQQQLIAESLSKNNFGITPIIARGTFDEHSQLQLYLEGPNDKFYKIITAAREDKIISMHLNNIYEALISNERTVTLENLECIDEQSVTRQIVELMLVIMMIAKYEKFNPFNQPSVDRYKVKIK
jgi:glucose-6-phosphate isomerase